VLEIVIKQSRGGSRDQLSIESFCSPANLPSTTQAEDVAKLGLAAALARDAQHDRVSPCVTIRTSTRQEKPVKGQSRSIPLKTGMPLVVPQGDRTLLMLWWLSKKPL